MDDHAEHMVTAKRMQAPDGSRQWVLWCLTCQMRIDVLPLCRAQTTKGAVCRNVVRTDFGQTRCVLHRVQSRAEGEQL